MHPFLLVVIKAFVGGTAVVAFAALSELLRPRGLAGIFAAAPSIALASLIVTIVVTGANSAAAQAMGMIAGAAALVQRTARDQRSRDRGHAHLHLMSESPDPATFAAVREALSARSRAGDGRL